MNINAKVLRRPEGAAPAEVLWRWALGALVAAAVAAGLYGRFNNLESWPLEADEYYIARSVENVLKHGLPEYDCGGFYTRGIVLQYLSAGLQLGGLSPELAPRLIAAVSSLLVLPAVFLLGRRLHGATVGLLAVILVSVSMWEIEMARFGRMYAPFQAVFVWYLLYFVRYTVDDDERALTPMLGLSVLGVLTWEGGALLAFTNLLPPFLRRTDGNLTRRDWRYLAVAFAVLVPLYLFATHDLRFLADVPALPEGYLPAERSSFGPEAASPLWSTIPSHPFWLTLALLPSAAALPALRWLMQFRSRYIAGLGLLAALAAVAVHQLTAGAGILCILLLARLLDWRELASRAARPFWLACIAFTTFWIAYGVLSAEWRNEVAGGRFPEWAWLAYQFVRFPDVIMDIVRPASNTIPALGIGMFLLLAIALFRNVLESPAQLTPERVLLALLLCLVLAVSATDKPRTELRYVYFLYPLALLLCLATIHRLVDRISLIARHRALLASVVALGAFALSEDFRPMHIAEVQAAPLESAPEPGHFHGGSDLRGAAAWLKAEVRDPDALIINGFPGVDFYFSAFDYSYIDAGHQRYAAYACARGTRERWGGLPLLADGDAIRSRLQHSARAYIVADPVTRQTLASALGGWSPLVRWRAADGEIEIIQYDRIAAGSSLRKGAQ